MMPILPPFAEVALLLVMAAGIGNIGTLARQPLIVSFIAVGLIAGPSALEVVRSDAQIDLLSQLGIAVLLFLVGIKLDVKLIRSLGVVSVMTGLGQVIFTAFFGYLIGLALGLGHITSLYVAVALTFSSTIIIVKLLSDKRETISARLAPLRDILLLFFFIALGATLDLSLLGTHVTGAILFYLFVLIGNPLIVLAIMGAMGYRKRTGFLAGLTVAQISEFSLILVAMGVSIGHVTEDALGLVTMVGLVTIAASTYRITYSHQLYALFEPLIGLFEHKNTPREPSEAGAHAAGSYRILILGLGRFGTAIGLRLHKRGIRVLGVDFNPQAVRRWRDLGLEADFGDSSDPEFVAELPFRGAEWMVSNVPIHPTGLSHEYTRRTLIQLTRAAGFSGRIAAASHSGGDSEALFGAGVDLVLEPFQDAADRAVEQLSGAIAEERTDFPEIAA